MPQLAAATFSCINISSHSIADSNTWQQSSFYTAHTTRGGTLSKPCPGRGAGFHVVCGKSSKIEVEKKSSANDVRREHTRATRALPIHVVTVAKGRSDGARLLVEDYAGKLRRYCPFTETQLRPNPKNSREVAIQVQAEGERVLRTIAANDWVVVLDERGRDISSEGLAKLIANAGDTGEDALVFCIGGPYGHSDAVRARANVVLRLSPMVLNHEIAFLVLLEQLYRAWTILRGEQYHH